MEKQKKVSQYDRIIQALLSIGKASDTRYTVIDAEDDYLANPVKCKRLAEKYLASVQQ